MRMLVGEHFDGALVRSGSWCRSAETPSEQIAAAPVDSCSPPCITNKTKSFSGIYTCATSVNMPQKKVNVVATKAFGAQVRSTASARHQTVSIDGVGTYSVRAGDKSDVLRQLARSGQAPCRSTAPVSVAWSAPLLSITFAAMLLCCCVTSGRADCIVTVVGPPLVNGGPANKMPLFAPYAVSPDETGGFYIADYNSNLVSRVFLNGSMITVAGNGDWDYNGDDQAATRASLQPAAVLSDGAGGFYISDAYNARIRRVGSGGIITTVAGGGFNPPDTSAAPATSVYLSIPTGLALDSSGRLYVADKDLMIICRINLDGTLVVVAGTVGVDGFSGDAGPATAANLYNPRGVGVDGTGGFYIADSENNRIRYVDASGVIRTVAGNAFVGFSGDNGPATSAQLSSPKGVVSDGVGGFYIADSFNNRVRQVDGAGIITTIAGGYQAGFTGDHGPASAALLTSPRQVALDGVGGIYIADQDNACVRRVFSNGTIATVAGLGIQPSGGDGGLGVDGFVVAPTGGAVDSKGTFYFVDSGSVRCLYANGSIGTVVRQNLPSISRSGSVLSMQPTELGLDSNDNLYITDAGHIVWLRYANGSIVHVAGTGVSGWAGDGGPATSANIYAPSAVKPDGVGGFYVADYFPTRIRHVLANGTIYTIAGNGGFGMQGDGGPATSAQLVPVSSIMTDGNGGILLSGSNTIRHVYASGLIGTMMSNRYFPYALISDRAGAYYLSENTQVSRVFPNATVVPVAGLSSNGYYGDGGPPALAAMNELTGLGLSSDGILYICDKSNNRVRAILPSSQCTMSVSNFSCSASSLIGDCSLFGTNLRAPVYVHLNGAACSRVTPSVGGSTASCMTMRCPLVPSGGGVQVVRVQSQFGDHTYSFNAPNPPPLLNTTVPQNTLHMGAQLTLSSQGSGLAHAVALNFIGNMVSDTMPCFGVMAAYNAATNMSTLTCTVQLVSEAGFDAAQPVQIIFDNAAILLLPPQTLNITFVRPVVNIISSPVISNEGGGSVNASFAFDIPSSASVGVTIPSMPFPCGGNTSRLRCWVGTSMCSSCTFRNDTSVLCVPPGGVAVLARVTVELCGLFNATSDGLTPAEPPNTDMPSMYVSYNPSSHLQASRSLQSQRVSTYNGTADVELAVSSGLASLLASLISEMEIGGAPCGRLLPSLTDLMRLVCYDWPVVSDLALSAGSKGRFNATIMVTFRGARLSLSTTVPLVYVPSVTNVLPSKAAPGALLSISGRWLDVDLLAVVSLGGSLSCVNVSSVTSASLVCTLPAVIPASTPGYPNLRIVVATSVGATYQPLTVTVPVETTAELMSTRAVTALSSFTALSGGVVIPLRPAIAVQTTGEVTVSCSISIAAYTCPAIMFTYGVPFLTNPSPPSIVGASALSAPTPAATILRFSDVGANAPAGCEVNLTVTCTDSLAHSATTESPVAVTMAQFHLAWSPVINAAAAFSVMPSENVKDLLIDFRIVNPVENTDLPAITDVLSCIAMIFPLDASISTNAPLSQATGSLSKVGAQLLLSNGSAALGNFTGLSTSLCALGTQYIVHAECTWLPTGERMRLQPLSFSLPNVSIAWAEPLGSSITALASTNIPLSLRITASSLLVLPAQIPCRWQVGRLSTYSITLVGSDVLFSSPALITLLNVSVMLQGSAGASLDASLQCTMWDRMVSGPALTLRTSTLSVQPVSLLPSTFIPSDSSQPWPISPALSFKVVDDNDDAVRDTSCTLSVVTEGVGFVGTVAGDLSGLSTGIPADATGVVTLPLFGINSPLDNTHSSVTLRVACQRATGDAAPPVLLNLSAPALHTAVCSQLPSTTTSGTTLPGFSIVLSQAHENGDAICQGTAALETLSLPNVVCTVSQRADPDPEYVASANATLFLQGSVQPLDAASRMATFTAFTVSASPGIKFPLQISCSIGSIVIPPAHAFDVQVVGCEAGTQSSGIFCQKCAGGEFSMGSSQIVSSVLGTCQRCPAAGATCKDGLIALHSDYFRAPSQQGQPLGPSTQLHACKTAGACIFFVNATTLDYSCAVGYTGPLCGVCDASLNYVQFGAACAPCWAPGASAVLIAFLVLLVLAALTRVALKRSDGTKSRAAIALKIALSYAQAVGSLRAFAAGGTAAYHDVFGWTDTVSASPFSFGALQCLWRPSFLSQYVATVMLPVAAAAAVMLIFVTAVTLRSLRFRPSLTLDRNAWYAAVRTWWDERRHVSTMLFVLFFAYMSIISSSLRALDCTEEIDSVSYLRQDLRVQCYVGEHAAASALAYVVLIVLGVGFPVGVFWLLASASPSRLADPQFQSANGFLYGGYRTGNEMDQRIAAAAAALYESRNIRTTNTAAEDDGEMVGIPNPLRNAGVGAVAPIAGEITPGRKSIIVKMPRASVVAAAADILRRTSSGGKPQGCSAACLGVLTKHVMWWESVILLRKAVLVLLALRVSNPYYQSGGAALWLSACLLLHVHLQPYSDPLFNILETWSLASAVATAVISAMLLQYDVTGSLFAAQSTHAMTSDEWGITIGMLLVNITALCVLVGTWLKLQWSVAAKAPPVKKLISSASTFRLGKEQKRPVTISQSASVFVHEEKASQSPPPCAPIGPIAAPRLSTVHPGRNAPLQASLEDGDTVAFAPVSVGENPRRQLKR